MSTRSAAIITVSDSRSAGTAPDTATAPLRQLLEQHGLTVARCVLVPDEVERIAAAIIDLADDAGVDLVLTTGGTGIGPRDVTPEATGAVITRQLPGIGELMRARSAAKTMHAWLSRATAGTRGSTLIVNVPGSPTGAVECAEMILPLVPHVLAMIAGESHDPEPRRDDAWVS